MSMLVSGYTDFNMPFDLETNVSLQGLVAMLLQRDENGKGM